MSVNSTEKSGISTHLQPVNRTKEYEYSNELYNTSKLCTNTFSSKEKEKSRFLIKKTIFISMGKQITKKIEKIELIKVEKIHNNPSMKYVFHYNLFLEGIEEPLIISNPNTNLDTSVSGKKIKFKLSDDNEISEFDIV